METHNCKIGSTMLGIEDHGIMTFFVHLSGEGWGQGLGGFAIDKYGGTHEADRPGFGPAVTAIRKILETVGVETWEDLPGTLVRAKIEGLGSSRTPIIGHYMKDQWFDLKEFTEANT